MSTSKKWRLAGIGVVAIVVVALAAILWSPVEFYFALERARVQWSGMESREVVLGSHHIHYWVGGEGPPLVMVHGLAGRGVNWRALMTGLKQRHKIFALDLLGFGESDKPEDADYSITQQTELLR